MHVTLAGATNLNYPENVYPQMARQCMLLYQTGIQDYRTLSVSDLAFLYDGIRQRLIDIATTED